VRLYSLAILQHVRGRGIGEGYLRKRLTELAREYDFCHLEVRVTNHAALSLYEKIGFVVWKRLPRYYVDEDGYRMRLDIRFWRS